MYLGLIEVNFRNLDRVIGLPGLILAGSTCYTELNSANEFFGIFLRIELGNPEVFVFQDLVFGDRNRFPINQF